MAKIAQPPARTLEQFLATIYFDPIARARFLAAPATEASRAGLSEEQCLKLRNIDRVGLEMASRSFASKRASKKANSAPSAHPWWRNSIRSLRLNLSMLFSSRLWFIQILHLSSLNRDRGKHPSAQVKRREQPR